MRPKSPMQLRDTYFGFGEGFARAFELAVTPALFGLAGYGLDRWLGIVPVLTIVFSLWAVIGLSIRIWYGYVARMEKHEASGPWAIKRPNPSTALAAEPLLEPGPVRTTEIA
ncbi:MAG: AtpZ/AtpI family protein [Actinomycetota bacterium]|nr:AtpZ/AtpI family protein [Actinomycetota bacterium]